jgi:2-hydroxy-6-oxonona-2,4-dienedioate hydrolase
MTPSAFETNTQPTALANAQAHVKSVAARSTLATTSHDDGDMVWRVWGNKGPNLVLLHGGSGSWTHWIHTIPAFEHSHRIYAADLPGLGDSPTPRLPSSLSSVAGIVAAGIEQLVPHDESVDLVTFSFGGAIGAQVAALSAARTQSLTLIGTPPFGIAHDSPANEITAVGKSLCFDEAREFHARNLRLLMLSDTGSVDELALHIHHENLRRARLKSRKIIRDDTAQQGLRDTRCHLRGVWGEQDTTIHPNLDAIRRLLVEVDASATFDIITAAGHWAPFEKPFEFNKLLARRLTET